MGMFSRVRLFLETDCGLFISEYCFETITCKTEIKVKIGIKERLQLYAFGNLDCRHIAPCHAIQTEYIRCSKFESRKTGMYARLSTTHHTQQRAATYQGVTLIAANPPDTSYAHSRVVLLDYSGFSLAIIHLQAGMASKRAS